MQTTWGDSEIVSDWQALTIVVPMVRLHVYSENVIVSCFVERSEFGSIALGLNPNEIIDDLGDSLLRE